MRTEARWRSAEVSALLTFVENNDGRVRATRGRLSDLRREFEADGRHLAQLMTDLQDDVRRTRLVPLATVLDTLPRIARDLARELGRPHWKFRAARPRWTGRYWSRSKTR